MPAFVIVGERRCGTTSLYHWMRAHPEVWLYPHADINYFVEEELLSTSWLEGPVDGRAWEESHDGESYAALFRDAPSGAAIGHKGADLLFWRPAHERIARFLPDARFLVVLRDPVARAWSQYWNEVGKGREWLDFEEALEREEERIERSDYALFHLAYRRRGHYADSLDRFHRHVPRERVLVLTVERLWEEPERGLREIYRFLGLDAERGLERAGQRFNANWTTVPRSWSRKPPVRHLARAYHRVTEAALVRATSKPETRRRTRRLLQTPFRRPAGSIEMPARIAARLAEAYAPDLERLETLAGVETAPWRRAWDEVAG